MKMNYVSAITGDGMVRAFAIDSTEIVERARAIHQTSPVCSAALGRSLTAASLMGALLKGEQDSLTLQIKGGGPAGTILCVSDAQGNVRGYVQNPYVDLPLNDIGKLDVSGAVGTDGRLVVIKDLNLREPYIGQTALISGEIAEDVTNYFAVSEQIPTACALGVLVDRDYSIKAAGGYLIQLLPGADDSVIDRLEGGIYTARTISEMIADEMTPEQVLREVMPGFDLEILDERRMEYRCNCAEARIERALVSLGRKELTEIADEEKEIEVGCQFCEKKYHFAPERLRELAAAAPEKSDDRA